MSDLSEDDLNGLLSQAEKGTPRSEKVALLIAEVRRHRAGIAADGLRVRTAVREAFAEITENRWWREGKRPYAEPEIVEAIANQVAARLTTSMAAVTELRLCEVRHLVLHPNQLYRFTTAPGCQLCAAEADLTPPPPSLIKTKGSLS